jgi:hypothetical protein
MFYIITVTAMEPLGVLRRKGRPVHEAEVAKFDRDCTANATRVDIDSIGDNGDAQTISIPVAYVRPLIAGLEKALARILEESRQRK